MNFADALSLMLNGALLSRQGWTPGQCMSAFLTDANGNTTATPMLYVGTVNSMSARTLWSPTQTDIMATDWVTVS